MDESTTLASFNALHSELKLFRAFAGHVLDEYNYGADWVECPWCGWRDVNDIPHAGCEMVDIATLLGSKQARGVISDTVAELID